MYEPSNALAHFEAPLAMWSCIALRAPNVSAETSESVTTTKSRSLLSGSKQLFDAFVGKFDLHRGHENLENDLIYHEVHGAREEPSNNPSLVVADEIRPNGMAASPHTSPSTTMVRMP